MAVDTLQLRLALQKLGLSSGGELLAALDELDQLRKEKATWEQHERPRLQQQLKQAETARDDFERERNEAQALVKQYEPAAKETETLRAQVVQLTNENTGLVAKIAPLTEAAEVNAAKVKISDQQLKHWQEEAKRWRGKATYLQALHIAMSTPAEMLCLIEILKCIARDFGYGDNYLRVFSHYGKTVPVTRGWHPMQGQPARSTPRPVQYALAS